MFYSLGAVGHRKGEPGVESGGGLCHVDNCLK